MANDTTTIHDELERYTQAYFAKSAIPETRVEINAAMQVVVESVVGLTGCELKPSYWIKNPRTGKETLMPSQVTFIHEDGRKYTQPFDPPMAAGELRKNVTISSLSSFIDTLQKWAARDE